MLRGLVRCALLGLLVAGCTTGAPARSSATVTDLNELLRTLEAANMPCGEFPTSLPLPTNPPGYESRSCWPSDRVESVQVFPMRPGGLAIGSGLGSVVVMGQNFVVVAAAQYARAVEDATGGRIMERTRKLAGSTKQVRPGPSPAPSLPPVAVSLPPAGPIGRGGDYGTLVRTDYRHASAWTATLAAIDKPSDEGFKASVVPKESAALSGLTTKQVLALLPKDFSPWYVLIADTVTMTSKDHAVLVVQLGPKPGRTFRAAASAIQPVENNLTIQNMDFEEFVGSVDADGVFRGF